MALAGLIVLAALGVATWALARSSQPDVPLAGDPEREDEVALREVFRAIGDPRALVEGQRVTLRLTQRQVSALLAEASRRHRRVSARAELREGGVDVTLSAESPKPWLTPYVNVRASVTGPPTAPRVERATFGSLTVPAALGQRVLDRGLREMQVRDPVIADAMRAVERLEYEADALTVEVRWSTALRDQLVEVARRIVALDLGEGRLDPYFAVLREELERDPQADELTPLLAALAAHARERVDGGAESRRELEGVFLALTLHALRLHHVLGEHAPAPLPDRPLRLEGRTDLAAHFLVSATTALVAERATADALGLGKELADADAGSGFSFADLAADRAGVQLIERGGASPARLALLLRRLARTSQAEALMPAIDDLPEGLDEAAFRAAYGSVESEPYRALVAQIDARIDACALHRALAQGP